MKGDMETKRIGLVLSNVPGYSETFFRNKIKGLQNKGFEVTLFVNECEPRQHAFLCDVVVAPNLNISALKKLLTLVSLILKACFVYPRKSYRLYSLDKKEGLPFKTIIKQILINQHLFTKELDWLHFGFGMLAVGRENIAQVVGAKMAVSFRGFDLYLSPLKHDNCYERLFKKDVKYHVLSQEMKTDVMHYNVPEQQIKVITPAIDTGFFNSTKKSSPSETIRFLTVARLHWKKGLEYTLEALWHLKQNGIKFHYTIIGEGSEFERLKFATDQMDITEEVTFMGKLPHDEVKKIMEQSDIYLQYSIQEGFCNAVLEAQAMGLLCVVSNAEGLSENVLHNKTGWVVPKRNILMLKDTIEDIIEMAEESKDHIRRTAMQRVRDEFHILQQQQDFVSFYTV